VNIYDDNAPKLIEGNYFPLIISPPGFTPSKSPVRWIPSYKEFRLQQGWNTRPTPILEPQPGANVGVRCGGGLVVLDYDDDTAALEISEKLPSPVNKAGKRAFSSFHYADFDVPSENIYDVAGNMVGQILSTGRQTVIPPSIHSDTGEPYRWTNGKSLYDTALSELPPLPLDYRARVEALGYSLKRTPEPPKHEEVRPSTPSRENDDKPCHELNQLALKNLVAWVPDLRLYKWRRRVGRYPNFEAVPTWRPSTEGKKKEDRRPNLRITSQGIKDWGVDKGYTALDLVIAARGCSLGEAFEWLEERVSAKKPDIEVDWEKITKQKQRAVDIDSGEEITVEDVPPIAPEGTEPAGLKAEAKKPESLVGEFWFPTDPAPTRPEMLIEHLIPDVCRYGILRGQMGAMKTFLLNSLAVAIASGAGTFAGHQASRRGLVLQGEFDGSYSEARLWAAMDAAGVDRNQPVALFKKLPPTILAGKKLNPEWRKWKAEFKDRVHGTEDKFGLPLTLLTMDPVNRFGGFDDENSSSEGNVFGKEMDALCEEFKCTMLVSDHLGKVADKGTRGTSTKEQNAFYVLDAGETAKAIDETRLLKIVRIKEDASGLGINFHMEPVEVEYDYRTADGALARTKRTTLVPHWDSEIMPVHKLATAGGRGDELSAEDQLALTKLVEVINKKGVELPAECEAPAGMRGVQVEDWFQWLSRGRIVKAEKGQTARARFGKVVTRLQNKKLIQVLDRVVWMPLPEV
jgi:hypothetical protein